MQLLVATKNAHKTAEIRAILGPGWTVSDLTARPDLSAPEETGATFLANAEIKALAASAVVNGLVLADDSGLEVDALQGAPGVRSARYAGESATDAENRALLLQELDRSGARGRHRSGRFRCSMVLAQEGRVLGRFQGAVEGVIIPAERGDDGFGYDSLFIPDGECQTFAQLPAGRKNSLSHRGQALGEVIAFLQADTHSHLRNTVSAEDLRGNP